MANAIYELAILLSLKDMASGGLNRTEAHLRSLGKEGAATLATFESLRAGMKKDFMIAGVGVGVLAMMKKGVDVAGDFEQSMARLKGTIAEVGDDGQVNMAKLNSQMEQMNRVAIQLGNTLPGSTADFFDMMTELRKTGMPVESITGGAARSVALLAISTGNLPKDIARDFGRLSKQFQLKPEEYKPAAGLFAKLSSIGLDPDELIQGAKFAQLRGGLPMGLKGIKGLDAMAMMLGSLSQVGLQGGIGGREVAGLLSELLPTSKSQKKADAALKKRGIDLSFYDKQGEFSGVENFMAQMAKLKTLSAAERMTILKDRFGTKEAVGPVSAFSEGGLAGWGKLKEVVKAAGDEEVKAAFITQTFNSKVENLEGTLKNLTATTFTPMMDSLKPALDLVNSVVGSLQEFGAANPQIAGIATGFIGVTSAAVALTFTLKSGMALWGLYQIASSAALKATQVELLETGAAADVAAVSAGRVSTALVGIQRMGALKITVALAAVGATYELISWIKQESDKYEAEVARRRVQLAGSVDEALSNRQLYGPRSKEAELRETLRSTELRSYGLKPGSKERVLADMETRSLQERLDGERGNRAMQERLATESWAKLSMALPKDFSIPYGTATAGFGYAKDEQRPALLEKIRSSPLSDPNVLGKLLLALDRGKVEGASTPDAVERIKAVLQEAFGSGGQFKMAQDIALKDMLDFSTATRNVSTNLQDWFKPTEQLPGAFSRAADAATQFSLRLGGLNLNQPPSVPFSLGPPKIEVRQPFDGSSFKKSGYVSEVHHHGNRTVHLHVHGVNDPQEIARLVEHELGIQMERA